ncbi:MAG TPA: HAD hydrolase family protein [Terriglobales bacterium]|nr:HAD hydrolase family protein [Terriglobales bacterium]
MSKKRARKIKLLLLDVDGVMTDGGLWFIPAPAGGLRNTRAQAKAKADAGDFGIASDSFVEVKGFHAHDGTAMSLARLGGLKVGLITKRISETVALRARDLRLDHVYQGCADKVEAFREVLERERLRPEQACYVGDDIIDLPVMRKCGFAVAVANAREEVKDESHMVTDHAGGAGAVRDAVEYILRAQGKWDEVVAAYLSQRTPDKKEKE